MNHAQTVASAVAEEQALGDHFGAMSMTPGLYAQLADLACENGRTVIDEIRIALRAHVCASTREHNEWKVAR
jgi:hypothetical protein